MGSRLFNEAVLFFCEGAAPGCRCETDGISSPQSNPRNSFLASITTIGAGKGENRGRAQVTIADNLGIPIAGATVEGIFIGDFEEIVTASTDSEGVAVIRTTGTKKDSVTFTFCVSDVTAGLPYDPDDNTVVPTCGSL